MTNEEIFKYAEGKLKKQESNVLFKYGGITFLGGVGLILMWQPLAYDVPIEYRVAVAGIIVVLTPILLIAFVMSLSAWFKNRRNFVYNLVRQDERNRCAAKMLRYQHEGSQ
jgi:hypothetical protein